MEGDFVVSRIAKKPPCKFVLREIRGRCKLMPDIEPLCLRAVERLERLHQNVAHSSEEDPLRVQYVVIVVRLWKITYKRPLLVRLAKCDTIAQMIGALQVEVDDLARGLGRDKEVEMTQWRDEWKSSRAQQFSVLKQLTNDCTDRSLVSEIKNSALLEQAMAELKNELRKKLPGEQLELKQTVLNRVAAFTKMKEVHLPDWLISVNDLVFDDGPAIVGSFGEIRRGTWYHDGVSEQVVVKQILNEIAGEACGSFTRQLNGWRDLPEHPNILKLHGGCNIGPRQFYVCEDVARGNIKDFCRVKRSSMLIWRIMTQVAEGLQVLHQHGIVHGGLVCSNILIDADNCPKLSDFGFSVIRSLSMGMSVSRYHFQPQQQVDVVEADSVMSQRIESDMYALANYQERPSIEDTIGLMRAVFPAQASFSITDLKGSPSSVKTLNEMASRYRRMPENEKLCRQVVDRLQFLHDIVAALDTNDPFKLKYIDVVVRFVKLLRRKPLLLRLGSSETIITIIRELQLKLTDVTQALGLAKKPEMTQWEQHWDADRIEQYDKLSELVGGASERVLVNEFRGDKKVQEALMTVHNGMKWKDQSPDMIELKQNTLSRVSAYLNQAGLRIFDWFIPIDDVAFEGDAIGNRGTLGDVYRGSWVHDGERTEVVIKRLFSEMSSEWDDAFLRQLELWSHLPDNDHILKLYGGSHVSSPQFYVCEYAPYGNLTDFLEDDKHGLFWRLFLQVAKGIEFLHSHKTVHGGLKCNNILVGDQLTAMLADFGFSTVRTLSAGLSQNAGAANAKSVRWKPKEVLIETSMNEPLYKSDVYSLGMCMIEAKTHEIPFGIDADDTEVLEKILSGERPERPDGLTDAEWDFISRLCDPEMSRRPTIDEVLGEIEAFALKEEAEIGGAPRRVSRIANDSPTTTETKLSDKCPSCTESSDGSERSCQCCGFSLIIRDDKAKRRSNEDITRHSFATYVKSHTKDEARQRVCDIAITLQDLRGQDIIHANVVPGSIRIGRDGCAQLVGFEFSKTMAEVASGIGSKREDGLRYIAPECLSGKNPSFESDVYSLGMCAIYALSREPPWGRLTSNDEIKLQVCSLHALPDKPDTICDAEWKLIKQMCTYDPADRMHIADVARLLAQLVSKNIPAARVWSLPSDTLRCPNDAALILQTPFVSRHLGKWKDAVVTVDKPEEGIFAIGRSFRSVADLWYSLKHPTIHELYGAYENGKKSFFVCENVERGDLSAYVRSADTKDADVWKVLLDAALALHYMHYCGIVHGDIGLHNILVTMDGRGKLSGFFLSCRQDVRSHSPEDESTGEEEWRPLLCSQGHLVGRSSDVYWLGRCIADVISTQSVEISSVSSKCALCLLGQLPPQPANVTVAEWKLVSDMCRGNIEMSDVVDRLARLAAVNAVVSSRLKAMSMSLSLCARQIAQDMILTTVYQYEEEDRKRREEEQSDFDDDLYDDDRSNSQNAMISLEQQIDAAAKTMFDTGDFVTKLTEFARTKWNTPTMPPSHLKTTSVPRQKSLYNWTIGHDSIVETGGVDEINRGGFASVWRGKWLGAPVALKKLSKRDQGQNLREEANLWFRVRHPHIVGLFGACCTGSHLFVCDFVEGGRLDEFCRAEPKPESEAVWGLLHEAAIGLQGLHAFNIVHADLKCDNILITLDRRAKLIDFGLSCLSTCDGGKPQGALRWKAPECLGGQGPTFASDVYGFGMCIVQAMSGVYPWGTILDGSVTYRVIRGELPKRPPAFTSLQWELVKRMCRFKPDERLDLDFVVKVLGHFAKRAPYVDDAEVEDELASWSSESEVASP